jgi:hypothetical protein
MPKNTLGIWDFSKLNCCPCKYCHLLDLPSYSVQLHRVPPKCEASSSSSIGLGLQAPVKWATHPLNLKGDSQSKGCLCRCHTCSWWNTCLGLHLLMHPSLITFKIMLSLHYFIFFKFLSGYIRCMAGRGEIHCDNSK